MLKETWHILLDLAPWLFVGAAAAGALHALVPADYLRRHLSGPWAVLKAALIGVPMPLCSCAVIPVGLSLRQQGASRGASVAFLISTPQTGVDSIAVSAALLGLPFALFKVVSAFIIGLAGGALTDALVPPATESTEFDVACAERRGSKLRAFFDHALTLLEAIWRWLVLGILLSAAITYFLPPDSLTALGAHGGIWAMLLAMAIGMPLYVCAVASVPIAAALVHGGFPPSAALVFLIAGPACNVATMGAVYSGLGRQTFIIYMLTIAIGSLACGWTFAPFIDLTGARAAAHDHAGHDIYSWWAVASAAALVGLLAWFAWKDLSARLGVLRSAKVADTAPSTTPTSIEVAVEGMTCQNCVTRLERALQKAEGVSAVSVTLHPGRAVVQGAITAARVRELVTHAGFQPG